MGIKDESDFKNGMLLGLYIAAGYRINAGSIAIPIALMFKYYLTSNEDVPSDEKTNWWMVGASIGIEF